MLYQRLASGDESYTPIGEDWNHKAGVKHRPFPASLLSYSRSMSASFRQTMHGSLAA